MTTRTIDTIVVHCSATRPSQDIGAVDIDRWHRARGWFGNGYHYVIRRDGTVESQAAGHRCRSLERAGAHVGDCGPGWNARSIGICLAGGVSEADVRKAEDNFTENQRGTLIDLLTDLLRRYPRAEVLGHRDLIARTKAPPKDCPSFDVRAFMREAGISKS